jgi:Fe-S-cluster containining protein
VKPADEDGLAKLSAFRVGQDRALAKWTDGRAVTCRRGCSACCSQMVFDVRPIEIEALGRWLRQQGRDGEALEALRRRRDLYDRTRRERPRRPGESHDDWTERVALAFWALGEPCVLLDSDGRCSAYELRPTSCRSFFVLGPADLCTPDGADDPRRGARLVATGGAGETALEALDRRSPFDPEDDRLDHALLRWLEHRSG